MPNFLRMMTGRGWAKDSLAVGHGDADRLFAEVERGE